MSHSFHSSHFIYEDKLKKKNKKNESNQFCKLLSFLEISVHRQIK